MKNQKAAASTELLDPEAEKQHVAQSLAKSKLQTLQRDVKSKRISNWRHMKTLLNQAIKAVQPLGVAASGGLNASSHGHLALHESSSSSSSSSSSQTSASVTKTALFRPHGSDPKLSKESFIEIVDYFRGRLR